MDNVRIPVRYFGTWNNSGKISLCLCDFGVRYTESFPDVKLFLFAGNFYFYGSINHDDAELSAFILPPGGTVRKKQITPAGGAGSGGQDIIFGNAFIH
jgi:hypothetical protein